MARASKSTATHAPNTQAAFGSGPVDIHSHLLPGIDDGCESFEESLACVRRLKQAGFVGSICTPHFWSELFPENTVAHVQTWTQQLRDRLAEAGEPYTLWTGGELRIFPGIIDWLKHHEIPTLAESRYVLADFWEQVWPDWLDESFDWLLQEGYQPILAHPERAAIHDLPQRLDALTQRGVLLQGNCRCMTGEEGFLADRWVRQFLEEERYTFFALDMHRPNSLESRLDGMAMVRKEFGKKSIKRMMIDAPRQLILGTPV